MMDWKLTRHIDPIALKLQIIRSPANMPSFTSMSHKEKKHALFLGRPLHFHNPSIYYTAIILNFFLRITWSLKLSTHFHLETFLLGGFVFE